MDKDKAIEYIETGEGLDEAVEGKNDIKTESPQNLSQLSQNTPVFGPDFFEVMLEWRDVVKGRTNRNVDWGNVIPVVRGNNGISLDIELHWSDPISADLGDELARVSEQFFQGEGFTVNEAFASDDRLNVEVQ
jgi:hypothetical protein